MRQSLNKAVVVIMLGLIPVTLALSRDEQKKHESLKWIQTAAYFKISQNNVKTKKIENSVLDILIQETTKDTNKKLEDLMEKDGCTLLSFEIRYFAPVIFEGQPQPQNTEIIQYGLFRALDAVLQSRILEMKSTSLNIRYNLEGPILVEFLIDGEKIQSPPLLTETIDKKWKRAD